MYLISLEMKQLRILLVCIFLTFVSCDVYLHNPRGSNNRWNENSRQRRNANRMFDSQNNDRGGYNVGSLYYYVGSNLQIEWTNQHSCGDQNNHCDVILQYMCGNQVRDGTTTSTIPANPVQCKGLDCNEDRRYGMHEDFYSYTHCRLRTRNTLLFTADQNVGPSARNTRQNRQGTRRGYECPEERDYYPYWGPTPWKDIAILTNDLSRCPMYLAESQNVKEKYACKVGETFLYQYLENGGDVLYKANHELLLMRFDRISDYLLEPNSQSNPNPRIPINKEECEEFEYQENGQLRKGVWQKYNSHGISAPACVAAPQSRDNHLGNGLGGQHLSYNWTIPDDVNDHCTLRIRYNISTTDYDRDNTTSQENNQQDQPGPDLWTRQGLSEDQGIARGYRLENNPQVNIFGTSGNKLVLQLAVNTAQYGRTFQDRSHTFSIRARPSDIPSQSKIQNINVRGKRGNIVQVYPGVEYDFVPNIALVSVADNSYVHFQWTGSDNNPGNNDGQGRAGTDRSNVVRIADPSYLEGKIESRLNRYGQLGSSYPDVVTGGGLGGFGVEALTALAILKPHIGGDMTELNAAGTYFDHGARKITMAGVYHYMCTRNNNFSNRSQKGKLIVTNSIFSQQTVDQNGGIVTVENPSQQTLVSVNIPASALSSPVSIELWSIPVEDESFPTYPENANIISDVVLLSPVQTLTDFDNQVVLRIKLNEDAGALYTIEVFRSNQDKTSWEKLNLDDHKDGMAVVSTSRGGYFVVSRTIAAGPLAGLIIGLLVLVVILVVGVVYVLRNKTLCKGYGGKV